MCGRYYVDPDQDEEIERIIDHIKNKYQDTETLNAMKTGEIFPTNIVPVLTPDSPSLMKWGFSRYDGKGQVINARLETATDKPMFRASFAAHRCLLPASFYFEWEKRETKKQKYIIGLAEPLFLAGLFRYEKESDIPLFVILTRPADRKIALIHDRMPVLIPREERRQWLQGQLQPQELLTLSYDALHYHEAI
jgi:putative SOS response-associated peptidase YedK